MHAATVTVAMTIVLAVVIAAATRASASLVGRVFGATTMFTHARVIAVLQFSGAVVGVNTTYFILCPVNRELCVGGIAHIFDRSNEGTELWITLDYDSFGLMVSASIGDTSDAPESVLDGLFAVLATHSLDGDGRAHTRTPTTAYFSLIFVSISVV
jgi:hypothetical protein